MKFINTLFLASIFGLYLPNVYGQCTTPTVTPSSRCGAGALTLSASSGTAGIFRWYAAASGGTALRTSVSATADSYTTPSLSATTTYYVTFHNGTCESSPRTAVVATVSALPSAPTVTPGSRCGAGAVTLSASSITAGIFRWYAAASGGTALRTSVSATADSYTTPSLSATTTYYVTVGTATCESSPRTAVVATVSALPNAPTVTPGSRCGAGAVTLSAGSSTAGIFRWYAAASGGTALRTSVSATTDSYTTPSLSATTTYYVTVGTATCESSPRTAVVATVSALPSAPTVTPGSRCGAGAVTLSASSGTAGIFRWYAAASGGTALRTSVSATTDSYTTPSLSATTTYYVTVGTATCESAPRTAVLATVYTAPTVTPSARCGAGTVTLSASSPNAGIFKWYSALTGGSLLRSTTANATSDNFTTPSITTTTTYYVTFTNGTCESSPRTAVAATVNALPTVLSVTGGGSSCPTTGLTWTGSYVTTGPTFVKAAAAGWGPVATSNESLAANTDGWLEFTLFDLNSNGKVCGFKIMGSSPVGQSTHYGFNFSQSTRYVTENGVSYASGSFVPGDVFRVARAGSIIRYYQNGALMYTSTVPSTTALQVYAEVSQLGASIEGIQTSFVPVAPRSIRLSGSSAGVNYQLRRNGANTGAPLAGTGSALTWSANLPGSYTVVATHATTTCASTMSGTAAVTPAAVPRTYSVTGGGRLPATVGLSGSQTGVSYQLRANGTNVGTPLAGTGSALQWPVTAEGNYTVVATNASCSVGMAGSAEGTNGWVSDQVEFNALKDLFFSTNGANWTNKTNWPTTWPASATAADFANWFGIAVQEGDVFFMQLPTNNLTGPLPASIGNLRALTYLDLWGNNLSGEMPNSMGQLTELGQLWLMGNQLTGDIPDLSALTKLQQFGLSYNPLLNPGPIPAWLNRPSLTALSMSGTNRTGPLPDFDNAPNLFYVELLGNQLSGPLPAFAPGTLPKLQHLFLNQNQLSGAIPPSIANLTALEQLLLDNNQLSGFLPGSLGQLPQLKVFSASYNQLTGPLPNNLTNLIDLNLGHNQLTGPIPQELGSPAITSLRLNDNQLTGPVPASFRHLSAVQNLYLGNNQLEGALPANLFDNMAALTNLDLSNNRFTGEFPSVANCTALAYAQCATNRFTSVPASFVDRPYLYWFDFANNQLRTLPALHQQVNKAQLYVSVGGNYLDFTVLEPLLQAGLSQLTSIEQNPIDDLVAVAFTAELRISARPKTASTALVWWKKQADGTWANVSGQNQDPTGQTYLRTPATAADEGWYKWSATILGDPTVVQSVEIEARQGPGATASPVLYNGLITTARWRTDKAEGTTGEGFKGMYHYTYDDKYQIQEANFSDPVFALNGYRPQGNSYRLTNMRYDPNGNIQTLRRFNGNGQVKDDFTYAYRQKAAGVTYNQLESVTGYSAYEYNKIGQMIKADKTEEGADQYVDYDVTGKVVAVYKDANRSQPVTRYAYDDRGFRMAKITYPNGSGDATTTWYIRDAGGNILSIYEQKGIGIAVGSGAASAEPPVQKEVPVYGSGKIGTYYPAHSQLADQAGHEAGSTAYEITDHLGNVRALLRSHVNEYTATLEDDGTATYTNPRVRENVYFKNLWASEKRDAQMNHTGTVVTPAPDRSAYLRWVGGQAGMDAQQKSVGPAIALAVKAGDRINASAWARFKVKASYSRAPLQNIIASVLSGQYAYSNGLESIAQAANTFNAGLLGLAPNGGDNPNAPSAYLNYILFDTTYQRLDAGAVQVPQAAGFEGPQRGNGYTANNLLKFENAIEVSQPGYLYVWVSNESEDTEVWFDDLNVVHHTTLVAQATDYEVWGGVLREQRYNPDENYRYGYQGQYSEHDEETNWNHFELREYDPVIGRTITTDPAGQFWSSYMWVGNNPISGVDPTGGFSTHTDKDGNVVKVYNDGDLGIYRHDDLSKWDGVSILSKSGNGISMMGETAFWDEFLSPETGKEFGKINFGASWDGVLDELHQKSKTMNLIEMAQNSKAGKLFDLKKDYPSEGRLLDGKYISSRSAGNYLAAFNAAFGKYGIVGVNFTGFMKLAGALHVHGKLGIELSKSEMGLLLTNSHKGDGPAPAYGENSYCYRMCSYGWGKARVGNFGWSNVMGIK